MAWKAKLKNTSNVDAGGYIEANFEIYEVAENPELEDTLLYPNCTVYCFPNELEDKMTATMQSLKNRIEVANNIEPNLEVTI